MYDPSAQYQLEICPLGRRPADEYYHQGQVWIEGREGSNYTIRFTNRSPNRVLAIFSVDGLDVLKGKPAGHLSEGYVVNGNSTLDIPGWKLDSQTAAEFYFSRSDKSYVAKIGGNVSNTGVIGAMVFKEWQQPVYTTYTYAADPHSSGYNPNALRGLSISSGVASSASLNNIAVTNAVSQNVGTGFGQATPWNTMPTQFVRENHSIPNAILAIYYDSSKNLQRRGIVLKSRYTASTSNSAFPAYTSGATPPPGWQP